MKHLEKINFVFSLKLTAFVLKWNTRHTSAQWGWYGGILDQGDNENSVYILKLIGPSEIQLYSHISNVHIHIKHIYLQHSQWNCPQVNDTRPQVSLFNNDSGNCCYQATSHYQNQCWPSSTKPYDVTGPQSGLTTTEHIKLLRLTCNLKLKNQFLKSWEFIKFQKREADKLYINSLQNSYAKLFKVSSCVTIRSANHDNA